MITKNNWWDHLNAEFKSDSNRVFSDEVIERATMNKNKKMSIDQRFLNEAKRLEARWGSLNPKGYSINHPRHPAYNQRLTLNPRLMNDLNVNQRLMNERLSPNADKLMEIIKSRPIRYSIPVPETRTEVEKVNWMKEGF